MKYRMTSGQRQMIANSFKTLKRREKAVTIHTRKPDHDPDKRIDLERLYFDQANELAIELISISFQQKENRDEQTLREHAEEIECTDPPHCNIDEIEADVLG